MDTTHLIRELGEIYDDVRGARSGINRHVDVDAWRRLDRAAAKLEGLFILLGHGGPEATLNGEVSP